MLYIQAMKCLYKVKNDLYKQGKLTDYKTMSQLINAIERKVTHLELKLQEKTQKKSQKSQ